MNRRGFLGRLLAGAVLGATLRLAPLVAELPKLAEVAIPTVRLPKSIIGAQVMIVNAWGKNLELGPSSSIRVIGREAEEVAVVAEDGTIDDSRQLNLPSGHSAMFICVGEGEWYSESLAVAQPRKANA